MKTEDVTDSLFKVKLLQTVMFQTLSVEMYGMELNELKMKLDSELYLKVALG